MTTEQKIQVLEQLIPLIDWSQSQGICYAVWKVRQKTFVTEPEPRYDIQDSESYIRYELDAPIPSPKFPEIFSWPLTPEGDEQRREFLRSHIERLKKEL